MGVGGQQHVRSEFNEGGQGLQQAPQAVPQRRLICLNPQNRPPRVAGLSGAGAGRSIASDPAGDGSAAGPTTGKMPGAGSAFAGAVAAASQSGQHAAGLQTPPRSGAAEEEFEALSLEVSCELLLHGAAGFLVTLPVACLCNHNVMHKRAIIYSSRCGSAMGAELSTCRK